MGRAHRIVLAGTTVHVVARGVRRLPIFVDDDDRRMFMAFLAQSIYRRHWKCLAYCLMPNHYHLVVEVTQPNLSAGMHRLNWLYALRFNERHGHVGHLFESRFAAHPIETEAHMRNTLSYVVLNPVRAGLCADPGDWEWSSFRFTAGLARCPSYLAASRVRRMFGAGSRDAAPYASYVRELAAVVASA
jgi:REP-associated tyrosine transposase